MENSNCPRAVDLVFDYLFQELPACHCITLDFKSADGTSWEIMVDGVGVGELVDTKLYLIPSNPRGDCTVVNLAHPESLQMLRDCALEYINSKEWSQIMKVNRLTKASAPLPFVVHRSSIGYKKICK